MILVDVISSVKLYCVLSRSKYIVALFCVPVRMIRENYSFLALNFFMTTILFPAQIFVFILFSLPIFSLFTLAITTRPNPIFSFYMQLKKN